MSGKHNKGFSLVELMVGLAILTTGMVAVGAMLMQSSEASKNSNQMRIGDALISEVLESMKTKFAYKTFFPLTDPDSPKNSPFRMEKNVAGSTTKYFYRDNDDTPDNAVAVASPVQNPLSNWAWVSNPSGYTADYAENKGKGMAAGQQFIYKWRVENPLGLNDPAKYSQTHKVVMVKLDVTVGWDQCTGDDPSSCRKKSKMTSFFLQAK
jgi:prepilin-type N-terminal cleavage/methylation domain-containing protein